MRLLLALAAVQAVLCAVVLWLSRQFVYGEGFQDRPIVAVLAVFGASFLVYLAALRVGLCCRDNVHLAFAIGVPAVVFRVLLLFSTPIQEVDIYRYLWDGAAAYERVDPYRYAPEQVRNAGSDAAGNLAALARIRDESASLGAALDRVHYAQLTTIYPPVSQIVFAGAHAVTPPGVSLDMRVTLMKAILCAFDVATIALVWLLVRTAGKHAGWVLAYAWCPLLLKEVANSGHLDAIAVFFTTGAILCFAQLLSPARGQPRGSWLTGAGVLLALAIGAKLYAIVLIPLLAAVSVAVCGWRGSIRLAGVALVASALLLAPMFAHRLQSPSDEAIVSRNPPTVRDKVPADAAVDLPPPLTDRQAASGLVTFLERWEINDFLFMLTVENVRPSDASDNPPGAWFAVVPNAWRQSIVHLPAKWLRLDPAAAGFVCARVITTLVFVMIAVYLAWQAGRRPDVSRLCEAAFLTLAWFWLLSPTQNPWYWTWALPLVPFARGRAWLALSGLVLVYYLRFWLRYHWPQAEVMGTLYAGAAFFDFVVTWLEYAPWFIWLAVAAMLRRRAR